MSPNSKHKLIYRRRASPSETTCGHQPIIRGAVSCPRLRPPLKASGSCGQKEGKAALFAKRPSHSISQKRSEIRSRRKTEQADYLLLVFAVGGGLASSSSSYRRSSCRRSCRWSSSSPVVVFVSAVPPLGSSWWVLVSVFFSAVLPLSQTDGGHAESRKRQQTLVKRFMSRSFQKVDSADGTSGTTPAAGVKRSR